MKLNYFVPLFNSVFYVICQNRQILVFEYRVDDFLHYNFNFVNCFLANGPPGNILFTASFNICSDLFLSLNIAGVVSLIPPG